MAGLRLGWGVVCVLMTREMDYALRVLRALYQKGQLSAAEVARQEHMPKAVTLKILKQLRAAGLVVSRRGPSGGYLLKQSCEQLSLWELFRLLGDPMTINRCQKPGYRCENRLAGNCGVRVELTRVQHVLNAELKRTPLSELFQV